MQYNCNIKKREVTEIIRELRAVFEVAQEPGNKQFTDYFRTSSAYQLVVNQCFPFPIKCDSYQRFVRLGLEATLTVM